MSQPRVIVLSGYGLNCEEETLAAFEKAGAAGEIIHINDLVDRRKKLADYQIMAIPGGFSYGDDTGSGNAFASRMRWSLWDEVQEFVSKDRLVIGLCNGCQILVNLGLVPAANGERKIAVLHNASGRYQCRWVDLTIPQSPSIWLRGVDRLHIPVAHGEGNFAMREETLAELRKHNLIAARYARPDGAPANGEFPYNPNGSVDDIAAVSDASGRVLAMMPHPERGMFFTQRDDWPLHKEKARRLGRTLPETSDGLQIFQNGVAYFV